MIKIGLGLPHYDFSFPASNPEMPLAARALGYAATAERLGFHQIWVSDHAWLDLAPPGAPPERHVSPECWTLLAALATTTSTIRLGSLVTPVGVRNRYLLKRTVDTVHQLAPGRLDVGLGAGWNAAEFTEHDLPFPAPAQRLAELRAAVDHLRSGRAGPPVWVGGKRPGLLAVAATADGWNTAWSCSAADYRRQVANLATACRMTGRDPGSVRRTLGVITLIGQDADDLVARWRRLRRWSPGGGLDNLDLRRWAVGRLVGTVPEVRQQARRWADLGVEQIICAPGAPFSVFEDAQLDLIVDALIS